MARLLLIVYLVTFNLFFDSIKGVDKSGDISPGDASGIGMELPHMSESPNAKCTYLILKNLKQDPYKYTHIITGVFENFPLLFVGKTNNPTAFLDNCSHIFGDEESSKEEIYKKFSDGKFYFCALDNIQEFEDTENTGKFDLSSDQIIKKLLLKDLSWSRAESSLKDERYTFVFKGTELQESRKYFQSGGSVLLSITVHNENGLQEDKPQMPVVPGSISIKISVDKFDVENHYSRLKLQMNIFSIKEFNQKVETIRYVSDQNSPGNFESTESHLEQNTLEGFIAQHYVKTCYTVENRDYFSKVNLETYTQEEGNYSANNLAGSYPESLSRFFKLLTSEEDVGKFYNSPFIYSCGTDRDGGYKHTGYSTFTTVITFDTKLKHHASLGGILLSFLITLIISLITIILAFIYVRKQPTMIDDQIIDQKSNDDHIKLMEHQIPSVHLAGAATT